MESLAIEIIIIGAVLVFLTKLGLKVYAFVSAVKQFGIFKTILWWGTLKGKI